ncbi:MAG TPA: nucleoside hydrolase [Candidatus Limnocylindrales bacterium]
MTHARVLLDTDIGNDIDDAVCLDYLLRKPGCELLGVTTVTAAPIERAKLASVLCRHAGRPDVPIVAGAERPIVGEPLQEPPLSLAGEWPHETSFDTDAMGFMSRTIRAHPHEVTLLAIGALTNVAQLLIADPGIAPLLKSLVLMGGRFFAPGSEWNIRNDPAAAAVVFGTDLPHLRAVGLDVTYHVKMDADEFRSHFTGPLLEFSGPWLERRGQVHFHDPLAATTLFSNICGYRKGRITVSNEDTVFDLDSGGPHEAAATVDQSAFFAELFGHKASHEQ